MKNLFTPPRAALVGAASLTALSLAFSAPATAIQVNGFNGPYDVSNWTTTGIYQGSNVNTSGAPNSIALNCPPGCNTGLTFSIATAGTGTLSFDWSYTSSGGPAITGGGAYFGYILNGVLTRLAGNLDSNNNVTDGVPRTGTTTISVLESNTFQFQQTVFLDGGATTTTITNFSAPATPVPLESDALPVVGAAAFMAGGLWWKKKRAGAKVSDFIAQK
jgi:hypothetical protein